MQGQLQKAEEDSRRVYGHSARAQVAGWLRRGRVFISPMSSPASFSFRVSTLLEGLADSSENRRGAPSIIVSDPWRAPAQTRPHSQENRPLHQSNRLRRCHIFRGQKVVQIALMIDPGIPRNEGLFHAMELIR